MAAAPARDVAFPFRMGGGISWRCDPDASGFHRTGLEQFGQSGALSMACQW